MIKIIKQILRQIGNMSYSDFSSEIINSTKLSILDTLSVIIKGSTYPNMSSLEHIVSYSEQDKSSYSVGLGDIEVSDAALWNGTAAHSVELDDFYRKGSVHPGVVVIPAVLACGQNQKSSGKEILKSTILGYEVIGRIGEAAKGTLYNRGLHPTSICGVYGSAVSSSYLYALSEYETEMAYGIAGNFSSGLMAYKSNGSWTKRLNAGWASKVGVLSTKLAKHGFTGPIEIIEGRYGYQRAFCEEFDETVFINRCDNEFVIKDISYKLYPSCRFTHSPIEAVLNLINQNHIEFDDILRIEVQTHLTAIEATMKPEQRKYRPETTVDAQFSIPYCVGAAAYYGELKPEYFSEENLKNNEVLKIADKVNAFENINYTKLFPDHNACKVVIYTTNHQFEMEILNSKGDPEVPVSFDEVSEKFMQLTEGIISISNQQEIIECIYRLEQMEDVNQLINLLRIKGV